MRLKLLNIVNPIDDGLPYSGFDLVPRSNTTSTTENINYNNREIEETPKTAPKVEGEPKNYTAPDFTYTPLPEQYAGLEGVNRALSKYNLTPQGRRAVLAQLGHESTWGTANQAKYNYGNLTTGSSWGGKVMNNGTDVDAEGNPITQRWRVYDTEEQFADDYMQFLKKLYPEAYNELFDTDFNIDDFTEGLVGGKRKYATDPKYREKIRNTYNSVNNRYPITRRSGGILYKKQ